MKNQWKENNDVKILMKQESLKFAIIFPDFLKLQHANILKKTYEY